MCQPVMWNDCVPVVLMRLLLGDWPADFNSSAHVTPGD